MDIIRFVTFLIMLIVSGSFSSVSFAQTDDDINNVYFVKSWLDGLENQVGELPAKLPTIKHPRKKALVIGNWKYENISPLEEVKNDYLAAISLFSSSDYSFDVTDIENIETVNDYVTKTAGFVSSLEPQDFVVIYYSGHGFNYSERSYLAPTTIPKDFTTHQVPLVAINLQHLIDKVWKQKPSYVLIIFDACRTIPKFTNPILEQSIRSASFRNHEFAADVERFPNTYFLFASETGYPSYTNRKSTDKSLYTEHLLKNIDPKKTASSLHKDLLYHVRKSSKQRQVPDIRDRSVTTAFLSHNNDRKDRKTWLSALKDIISIAQTGSFPSAIDRLDLYMAYNSTSPYMTQAIHILEKGLIYDTSIIDAKYTESGQKIEFVFAYAPPENGALMYRSEITEVPLVLSSPDKPLDGVSIKFSIHDYKIKDDGNTVRPSIIDRILRQSPDGINVDSKIKHLSPDPINPNLTISDIAEGDPNSRVYIGINGLENYSNELAGQVLVDDKNLQRLKNLNRMEVPN